MGIFSKYKEYRRRNLISQTEKYGDTLKTLMTTKEQRLEAIEFLAQVPPELAIPQLLKRFDLVVDSGMLDTREKDMACTIILGFKELAKPFVEKNLEKTRRIAWLIKLAEKLFSPEEFLELLLKNLKEDFVEFDEAQLERNTEILLALKEHNNQRIVDRVTPLCKNRNEGIRMAAIECMEAQALVFDDAKQTLLSLLKITPTDDNSRLLGVVRSIAERHNWI